MNSGPCHLKFYTTLYRRLVHGLTREQETVTGRITYRNVALSVPAMECSWIKPTVISIGGVMATTRPI